MYHQRKGYWFSPEERIAIVREFEKGGMTLTQIQAKYGIKGHSTKRETSAHEYRVSDTLTGT